MIVLKKRMIVIGNVFPRLKNVKRFVRPLANRRRLGTRLDSQRLKALQIPEKSP